MKKNHFSEKGVVMSDILTTTILGKSTIVINEIDMILY